MMTLLFQKLGLNDHQEVVILNAPKEFAAEITALKKVTSVSVALKKSKIVSFLLIFVKTQKEIDILIPALLSRLQTDVVLWMAYPDGASKKHRTEITRDRGWDIFGSHGFQSVRHLSLDNDWSGICFQRIEYLKTLVKDTDARRASVNDSGLSKKSS